MKLSNFLKLTTYWILKKIHNLSEHNNFVYKPGLSTNLCLIKLIVQIILAILDIWQTDHILKDDIKQLNQIIETNHPKVKLTENYMSEDTLPVV